MEKNNVVNLSDARRKKQGKPPRSRWDAWLDTPKEQWEHEYGPWMWKNAPWAEDVKSEEFAVSLENVCTDMADHGNEEPTLKFAVEEAKYVLSTFFESGHFNADAYNSNDPEIRKWAREEVKHLRAFIRKYEKHVSS